MSGASPVRDRVVLDVGGVEYECDPHGLWHITASPDVLDLGRGIGPHLSTALATLVRRRLDAMNREQEAIIWTRLGRGFESIPTDTDTDTLDASFAVGICLAQRRHGLPAYGNPRARVRAYDTHGAYWRIGASWRRAAYHRALTCYLMAEMVRDGRAPGGGPPR